MQRQCPRCGAELTADAAECPTCAYGDVEDLVLLEALRQAPGAHRLEPGNPSPMPRVLAGLAILVVVVVAILAVVD